MICRNCGAEMANDSVFCSFCGKKMNESYDGVNDSVAETAAVENNDEKYSGKEMVNGVAKLITGGLSLISGIMVIGGLLGFFDKNPIPFIIFVGIVMLVNKLEEKMPKVPVAFWAVFEIAALIICFSISSNAGAVLSVKNGSPNQYSDITYEEAFEGYFSNPTWESCGKDEDGNEVVKFTGGCSYLGNDAIAEVKFKIYKEQESFVVSSVKINGEDMALLGNALIINVFEEYENSH